MKIAQITMRFYPAVGGVETHVLELTKRLIRDGHEVTIITSNLETERPWKELKSNKGIKGVKIIRLKAINIPYYPIINLPDLKEYDIVHAHNMPRFYVDQAAIKSRRLIITTHGLHFHEGREGLIKNLLTRIYYNTIGRLTLKKACKIISISKSEKEFLKKYVNKKKIVVIGNGINYDKYKTGKGDNLLFIGRLVKGKGLEYLIKAIKNTRERLDIIGDGPYKNELRSLIKKQGLTRQVRLHGFISESRKIEMLSKSKALILPSKYEAFGIVLLEAMASGKPVIATRVGGIPDIVNKDNGILVPYANVKALRRAIKKINNFKTNGRIKAKEYDWERIYNKVLMIYNQCLK